MEILFAGKLEKIMNDSRARQKKYGELARFIGQRLDDLQAIENLGEAFLLPGRFEPLVGDRAGQCSMRLSKNYRLIFEPANDPLPAKGDGSVDFERVNQIQILGVEDYHH